ncbi:hypothetical protein Ciccas_009812, partial [Cichlidogyrus casuarinus]
TGEVEYRGELEIVTMKDLRNPSRDINLPFSCVSKQPTRKRANVDAADRKQPIFREHNNILDASTDNVSLWLRLVNEFNDEVSQVGRGDNIKLDILLVDSSNEFRAISVDKCSALTNQSEIVFILNNCPFGAQGIRVDNIQRLSTNHMSTVHLQSQAFQPLQMTGISTTTSYVSFRCQFKLCSSTDLCN